MDILEAAYAGLLHDIGKFEQRSETANTLNESELENAVYDAVSCGYGYLHSGYTFRFLREVLSLGGDFTKITSGHHSSLNYDLSRILTRADKIASGIDCLDEEKDKEDIYKSGEFFSRRMDSVFSEIDFGKNKERAYFNLSTLENIQNPAAGHSVKSADASSKEYSELWNMFTEDLESKNLDQGEITKRNYDAVYSSLQKYCSLIPSTGYDTDSTYVSLFDHLKLTSAIAACLAETEGKEDFYMLEFDISGIQKFIYKVVEGSESKKGIAKALRGRSFFVSMVCGYITYSFLNEFKLPQANIIFNTGGGALLMLPGKDDTEKIVNSKTKELLDDLHELFGTDITFVYALEKCNAEELEYFKTDKAIKLKSDLERQKAKKYESLIDRNLYYMKTDNNIPCRICGYNLVGKEGGVCNVCSSIEKISDFIVKSEAFFINYHLGENKDAGLSIGKGSVSLSANEEKDSDYTDSVNQSWTGNTRHSASLVPKRNGGLLNFESICDNLLPGDETGDRKLAVLKMDVDNLGAVFAYGMGSETRSLSKYQNLSRMMENFFSIRLEEICRTVSADMNPEIENITDNGTMFYINYAGGDDLVILGPAKAVLRLAKRIRDEFRAYVLNDNITLSGGIHIQNPKQPVRYGVLKAEEMLEKAKQNSGKNSLGLMDEILTYAEYDTVLDQSDYYQRLMINGIISRALLYQYMKVLDECDDYDTYLSKVPRLLYSIIRNVKSPDSVNELKKKLLTSSNLHELKIIVLAMKLAIMETRDNNG